jgi:penicillin amidase
MSHPATDTAKEKLHEGEHRTSETMGRAGDQLSAMTTGTGTATDTTGAGLTTGTGTGTGIGTSGGPATGTGTTTQQTK